MIHQCYFAPGQRSRLFSSPAYCGFGLEPEVNADIGRNCPELQSPRNRPLLCEYAALLHHWRNPELDGDSWIGFSSYRQLDKFTTVFQSRREVEELLSGCDIVGWGGYRFHDAGTKKGVSLAEQGERCHPGLTSCLWQLLLRRNEPMPANYLIGNVGLFCSYWVMSRANFEEYMRWSAPLAIWLLEQPDPYLATDRRSVSFVVERLFICWYGLREKRVKYVGAVVEVGVGNTRFAVGEGGRPVGDTRHETRDTRHETRDRWRWGGAGG